MRSMSSESNDRIDVVGYQNFGTAEFNLRELMREYLPEHLQFLAAEDSLSELTNVDNLERKLLSAFYPNEAGSKILLRCNPNTNRAFLLVKEFIEFCCDLDKLNKAIIEIKNRELYDEALTYPMFEECINYIQNRGFIARLNPENLGYNNNYIHEILQNCERAIRLGNAGWEKNQIMPVCFRGVCNLEEIKDNNNLTFAELVDQTNFEVKEKRTSAPLIVTDANRSVLFRQPQERQERTTQCPSASSTLQTMFNFVRAHKILFGVLAASLAAVVIGLTSGLMLAPLAIVAIKPIASSIFAFGLGGAAISGGMLGGDYREEREKRQKKLAQEAAEQLNDNAPLLSGNTQLSNC